MTHRVPHATLVRWCRATLRSVGTSPTISERLPHCPFTPEQGAVTPTFTAAVEELPSIPNGAYVQLCQTAYSVRTRMTQELGENATVDYQRKLCELARSWIRFGPHLRSQHSGRSGGNTSTAE